VVDELGVAKVAQAYKRFGLEIAKQPDGLSIGLGAGLATPLQVAHAYTVFANEGKLVPVSWIVRIEDGAGNVLLAPELLQQAQHNLLPQETSVESEVITPETAYIVSSGLRDVIRYGTARGAKVLARDDLYGKTGTTNNQVDAWFAGYNPDIVAAVWAGYDDIKTQKLKGMGSRLALPIWIDFMRSALPRSMTPLEAPDGTVQIRINRDTGLPAVGEEKNTMFEVFAKNNIPDAVPDPGMKQSIQVEETSLRNTLF
jgi:penicillin-binding protein 1A